MPNASAGRSSRRRIRGPGRPPGSNRSAIETPSASAIRRSDAMLALDRPRSTWLRKLSLRPDRSAIVRSVQRLDRRSPRSRSPTSTSADTSGALEGMELPQTSFDPVEGKLKRPYGLRAGASTVSTRPSEGSGPDLGALRTGRRTVAVAAADSHPAEVMPLRVLLADDHPLILWAFRHELELSGDFEIVAEV